MVEHIHIIAEAGTNHNGKLETAKALADAAKQAGADSVKYQLIYPEGLYLPKFYKDGSYTENDVFKKRAAGMLSDKDYHELAAYCKDIGVPFTASLFDLRGLDLLESLDVPYFKTASCDLNNIPLLVKVAERGRKMVISTGMARLAEIENAVSAVFSTGNTNVVLMHCVSVYPATLSIMNLAFIDTLRYAFGVPVGLSDHTENSLAAAVGVSKGVTWIEKHFTLDRKSPGFDHAYAMEPSLLKQYISDVRDCESACRSQLKKIQDPEAQVKSRARRGLYAARDIGAGEMLEMEDILIVRPEGPLVPADVIQVIGRVAERAIHQYEPLSYDLLR